MFRFIIYIWHLCVLFYSIIVYNALSYLLFAYISHIKSNNWDSEFIGIITAGAIFTALISPFALGLTLALNQYYSPFEKKLKSYTIHLVIPIFITVIFFLFVE